MDFQNQYEREKHEKIIKCYNENVRFFSRGSFRINLGAAVFFAWIVIWTESAIRYYSLDYVDFSIKNPRIYIIPVILLVIGWKLFKPYRILTERTCFGKISDITFSSKYVKGKRMGRRVEYLPVVIAKLSIDTGTGKTYTYKARFNKKTKEIFEKGVYITVIKGEKYPVCHDKSRYCGELFCTNCSSLSSDTYTVCFNCKKRLWIKGL